MNTPRVSIVIPTFNRARVLRRALESVAAQTFTDYEVIVVDDGSTDATGATVDLFSARFGDRLKTIRLDGNGGAARARNAGVAAARGGFVAFLDADDEWQPAKLEIQLAAFDRGGPQVGAITTSYDLIDRAGRSRGCHPLHPKEGSLAECALDFISGEREIAGVFSTLMFRRELFAKLGGLDETLMCWEDADFFLRAASCAQFRFVPEALTIKHDSPDSISFNWPREAAGVSRFWTKYRGRFGSSRSFRKHLAWHQHSVGIEACLSGCVAEGRRLFRESLAIWPYDVRPAVHLATSLAGAAGYAALWSRRLQR